MEIAKINTGRHGPASAQLRRKPLPNFLRCRFACSFAALLLTGSPTDAATRRLDYRVSHSTYGDIGTYSNVIETEGATTTVTSALDVKVTILGLVAYRRESRRVEQWNGDRLISFHGVSNMNGKKIVVSGAAVGDGFVVTLPSGKVTAPASIRVANPWTGNTLNGDTILLPDEGVVQRARLIDGGEASVTIGDREVRARQYDIALIGAKKHYLVWFDAADTPVKFNIFDSDGICTFTLSGPKPPDVLLAQRAPR